MDHDIDEWLATDTALDRPVLIRLLLEATRDRRDQFLEGVRGAAAVPHTHIVDIFEAGDLGPISYSVSEWAGGMTLADRTAAHEPVGSEEFLPNASGLAAALAALHESGGIHGALDESAVLFSAAHPAKLASFGRPPVAHSVADDTRMLAETLERSLTGYEPGTVAPSQVIDTVDSTVDTALSQAQTERPDARMLASTLRGAPTPRSARRVTAGWSWNWLIPTAGLAVVAVLLVGFGLSLARGTSGERNVPSPTTVPAPAPNEPAPTSETSIAPATTSALAAARPVRARAFDPFGGDGEHNELQDLVIDGDFETSWKTESYFDPLPRLKPGVGITVEVAGSVNGIQAAGIRDGSQWALYWSPEIIEDLEAWTPIASGTVRSGGFDTDVPARQDGVWLIWFTDLPASNEGTFNTTVAEVRFRP